MEKVRLNPLHGEYELYNDDDLILTGGLEAIVRHKIDQAIIEVSNSLFYRLPVRKAFNQLLFVTPVKKSKSGKSVYQHNPYGPPPHITTYNLPEQFRKVNYPSILAIQRGPFTKTLVNGQLVDCPVWYCYEVSYAGHPYACLELALVEAISHFLINDAREALTAALPAMLRPDLLQQKLHDISILSAEASLQQKVKETFERVMDDLEEEEPDSSPSS